MKTALFDTWTNKYDSWFNTPTGKYVRQYEAKLLLEMLNPQAGEQIFDGGCGTGIFTRDIVERGTQVTGMDLSYPMLEIAVKRLEKSGFSGVCGNICSLPFPDNSFDKVVSMTAIEFIEDSELAIAELNRVVRPGGSVVVTTLNSLSPWATRRNKKAKAGHTLFQNVYFRSPDDMRKLVGQTCNIRTAIHFAKDTPVEEIPDIEKAGQEEQRETGAFLAVQWKKN